MKLRNKKTGEIITLIDHTFDNYNSLEEVKKDWEDCPEELWFIGSNGRTYYADAKGAWQGNEEIGNKFCSEEECKAAVEKLKALARLKAEGFKFKLVSLPIDKDLSDKSRTIGRVSITMPKDYDVDLDEDIELLFGE